VACLAAGASQTVESSFVDPRAESVGGPLGATRVAPDPQAAGGPLALPLDYMVYLWGMS
jgi:hypothetical protein